jgi:centractin
MAGAPRDAHFVGSKAEELKGLMKLKWPVEHGIVKDWEDMEKLWTHVYDDLHISAEEVRSTCSMHTCVWTCVC